MSDEHSSARTAIAREAFPLYLQNEFIDKDKDGSKAFIHFHNHPNMGPGASGTDVSTQESFSKYPWFLFVIVGKGQFNVYYRQYRNEIFNVQSTSLTTYNNPPAWIEMNEEDNAKCSAFTEQLEEIVKNNKTPSRIIRPSSYGSNGTQDLFDKKTTDDDDDLFHSYLKNRSNRMEFDDFYEQVGPLPKIWTSDHVPLCPHCMSDISKINIQTTEMAAIECPFCKKSILTDD